MTRQTGQRRIGVERQGRHFQPIVGWNKVVVEKN
jgi:hypothetical protein